MPPTKTLRSYSTLRLEAEDGVATLTLDRPERMNAFTFTMAREWLDALEQIDADDAIRAVIVTGAGKAFCAGADLSGGGGTFDPNEGEMQDASATPAAPRDVGGMVSLRLFRCRKPIVAAINGAAVGVGVTAILPMDVRLASERARFGFVFTRRGIVPEACSSWFLPRVVGIARAMEWVTTGRVFDAAEALRGGLVSEVLPHDALLPRARALAIEIAANTSAVSVALARQMMWQMLGAPHPMAALRLDSAAMTWMGARADSREGVESFLEKRPARFPLAVSRDFPAELPWLFPDEPPYEP
ncbi:MAG: crotonase/enoyl-CoA hydratase family protein [Deltaproteobacteria bacterium]|nr:crotonase/enoyl-CoA hydratase family protein [Deltaproteobacteria bacterium]